ncbi:MAG: hypothetical protein JNL18_23350 [Planctomycetaceae bacterium]|uniref:hypothetical protein n=1 Tax=Lacipirellula limnantheis TaxID=2528024 RepID=UPI0011A7DC62|nr:hypothetical protein [Lacipirellula limnantheis]MBL9165679.1 hypothetical protein [Planctomycetaceae bacterium]
MDKDLSPLAARVVADLRALSNLLIGAGNHGDAIRLQGYAASVRQIEGELLAAESRRAVKPARKRRGGQRQTSAT